MANKFTIKPKKKPSHFIHCSRVNTNHRALVQQRIFTLFLAHTTYYYGMHMLQPLSVRRTFSETEFSLFVTFVECTIAHEALVAHTK